MNYVFEGVASEDMVQLFAPSPAVAGTPVTGVLFTQITVTIRKATDTGFVSKAIVTADWVDRGGGNYSIQFSAADFDTLGAFRYNITPIAPASFVVYEDILNVVDEIPAFPLDPPAINEQTDTPVGISPDPVARLATLTISGEDLSGATSVTIGGISVPITANTSSAIDVTVIATVPLGTDLAIVVETAGGQDTASVSVVLAPGDIPGAGMVNLYGFVYDPSSGQPIEGVGMWARVLDMPNIGMGVAWTDDVVTATTDSNGRWDINMPRDVRVEVSVPRTRYRRVFVAPNVVSANILTEIP